MNDLILYNSISSENKSADSYCWFCHNFITNSIRRIANKIGIINQPFQSNIPLIKLSLLDPTIRENALAILNISEEDTKDSVKVNRTYTDLTENLVARKAKVSEGIALMIEQMIENINIAFKTIHNHLEN
jgi:hypothetical protein